MDKESEERSDMNMEKIKEVFTDEVFVASLFQMETMEKVQAALQEKDLHLTEEEILSIRDFFVRLERGEVSEEQMKQLAEQVESGEISEEMLEQVTGGSICALLAIIATYAAIGGASAATGAAVGYGVVYCIDNHGW